MPRVKHIDDMQLARTVAGLASAGAAAIHFAVFPAHLSESLAEGAFFAALAAFQVLWALALWQWQRWQLLSLGALVNAGAVLLWLVTRTTGLPFGPGAGVAEPVGLAGMLTIALELAVCVSVLWWLRPRPARMLRSAATSLTAVGAAVAVVLGLSVPGVLAGVGHHHGGGGHHDQGAHQQGVPHHDEHAGDGHQGPAPANAPAEQGHHADDQPGKRGASTTGKGDASRPDEGGPSGNEESGHQHEDGGHANHDH